MRFKDLIEVDDLDNSNVCNENKLEGSVITALMVIHNRIQEKNLKPEVKLSTVLKLLSNATRLSYTKEDLISMKNDNDTIDSMIKNIDDQIVEFSTQENEVDTSENGNTDEVVDLDQTDIPQNTVSNMAKSAMRRRQD
jgi:hypothetical protein